MQRLRRYYGYHLRLTWPQAQSARWRACLQQGRHAGKHWDLGVEQELLLQRGQGQTPTITASKTQ